MKDLKKDFPIFKNNPGLVYLDNAATTLKPSHVVEGICQYLNNDYANIHRGMYEISQRSEELYFESKDMIAEKIGGKEHEIVYTFNSTYAFNILAQTLLRSGFLKKGDKVLLSISEHHANLVPWMILKQDCGIDIDYVNVDENFDFDIQDFKNKYDDKVKLVSLTRVSNVTGSIKDLETIGSLIRDDTIFAVDASQAVPNFQVDVKKINCDFLAFTGHKLMASTGIGVFWIKNELSKQLKPSIGGGGSILSLDREGFQCAAGYEGFEPGTPNLVGAISLLKAFEYIDKIGGFDYIIQREKELNEYVLQGFAELEEYFQVVGKITTTNRVGVFSFVSKQGLTPREIGSKLAKKNICIRCGGHCAHPLLDSLGHKGTCRMSLYVYNDKNDIDRFFEELKNLLD